MQEAENTHYTIEMPDAVGVSTITDRGDGTFVCINRTTVTVGDPPHPERYRSTIRPLANQQHQELTFKNNRWESRPDMSIPPSVVKMKNGCGTSYAFAACAISANQGAELVLHLGTLKFVTGILKFREANFATYNAAMVPRRHLNGLSFFKLTYPISTRVRGIRSWSLKKADWI
ncbi:hypothetical protein EDC04DRAFT_2806703 [Pisolithus marmoratus]|nr:hypothetical protein EDC04DRAFT_2806703 [Pisolithus marmoratus]